ncbi:MAG: substrate-binding domain-containing protein [Ktedonobacteraceae bacterium]|nr:substrate-binding domain-containing protein [Ktedonobacteraceae bacterium]
MDNIEWWRHQLCRRKFLAGAVAIASGAGLVSCNRPLAQTPTSQNHNKKRAVIALVLGVQNESFYITMQKGAQQRANELGISLISDAPAQFDPALQTVIVEAMIARRVDAILIAACDKDVMIKPLKHAYDAGIKIISVDTSIGNGDYIHGPVTFPLSYIGSDNVEGGRIAGSALIKAIGGKGKVYVQSVKPTLSTVVQRAQGFRDAIEATEGAVTMVKMDYNDDSSMLATEQTANVLHQVKGLSGIFGVNMPSALGAAQAVKATNQEGVIQVVAIDAPDYAVADIRNGVVDIAIAQLPGEMGRIGVEYAIKALSGQTSSLKKRVVTNYFIIDKNNVDTSEAQAVIYKSK